MTTEPYPEQPLYVHCLKCEREWFVAWLPMPVASVTALMKIQRCACGSKKLGMNRRPSATPEGDPIAWLDNGDTGTSSETIWSVMMNRKPRHRYWYPDHPHDPADFGRCHRLLRVMPSWRPRLNEVADKYPKWRGLVLHWDRLAEMYEAALTRKDGRAPEMYALMRKLIDGETEQVVGDAVSEARSEPAR
jgi:hypothetical protein